MSDKAESLIKYFGTTDNGNFNCPFHGEDERPSLGVDFEEGVFNCFTCGTKGHDGDFAFLIYGARTRKEREKLKEAKHFPFSYSAKVQDKDTNNRELSQKFYFSESVLSDLEVVSYKGGFAMPIHNISGEIWDLRVYNKDHQFKVLSQKGGTTGLIHPIKHLIPIRHEESEIYIVAGEKDMLIARSMGINAFMISGGENMIPRFYGDLFKNKIINICYDNDNAGRVGAGKLATHILTYDQPKKVNIVNISSVCKENKEDTYDFFIKYNKTVEEFHKLPREEVSLEVNKRDNCEALIHIQDIQNEAYYNKNVSTFAYCMAASYNAYGINTKFKVHLKYLQGDKIVQDTQEVHIKRPDLLLELILASKFEIHAMQSNMAKSMITIPKDVEVKEISVVPTREIETFYTSILSTPSHTPMTEEEQQQIKKLPIAYKEMSDLSLQIMTRKPMVVGHTYRIYTKPLYTKSNKGVCTLFEYQDFIDLTGTQSFNLNNNVISSLNTISSSVTYMEDGKMSISKLFQDAESILGTGYNVPMYLMMMVTAHSLNNIKTKSGRVIPGTIDSLFLGSSRVGKSVTAHKIIERLSFGKTISLATSSTPGLIAGVTKIGDRDAARLGELPRQHEKLLVMEELSKAPRDLIRSLTDVRSSKEARLTKIVETSFPANVRMITLSNPYAKPGTTGKSLNSYRDGVAALCELVENPEDLARYDFIQLIGDNDDWQDTAAMKVIADEHYINVHRWAITRTPDDLEVSDEVYRLIDAVANKLNNRFACDGFRLFSSETAQKLLKMSIGLAGMTASTGSTVSKLRVRPEHVYLITKVLLDNYNDPLFKLDEYKEKENQFVKVSPKDIEAVQRLMSDNVTQKANDIVKYIVDHQTKAIDDISIHVGVPVMDVSPIIGELSKLKLVEVDRRGVTATKKLREAHTIIEKGNKRRVSSYEFY